MLRPTTQTGHVWTQNSGNGGPSDQRGHQRAMAAIYDGTPSARTTPRAPRALTSSAEWTSSFLHRTGPVPLHPWPLHIARPPVASSSQGTTPNISIRRLESSSSPTSAPNDAQEWAWPSTSCDQLVAPPPHTRPLYATIPLPAVDEYDQWHSHRDESITTRSRSRELFSSSSSSGSTPPPNPNPPPFPSTWTRRRSFPHDARAIQLHPILQRAYLSTHRSPLTASRPMLDTPSTPMDWARDRHAPATNPGVGYLTLFINTTGETIGVCSSLPSDSYIVTVSDVLDALGRFFNITDQPCRGRCPTSRRTGSCECERISAIVNSLELWWRVDEDALAGRRPWQLVVGQR